jgi:hypothetical protein
MFEESAAAMDSQPLSLSIIILQNLLLVISRKGVFDYSCWCRLLDKQILDRHGFDLIGCQVCEGKETDRNDSNPHNKGH